MERVQELIERFALEKHPEGGYFAEVYTAESMYQKERETAGSIYFLLGGKDLSHFHVIDCDEVWYFHEGCGMRISIIDEKGKLRQEDLGMDLAKGEKPMIVLHPGEIFAAENLMKDGYTFVSCMTTPQFQYQGFRMVKRSEVSCNTENIAHLFMSDEEIDSLKI